MAKGASGRRQPVQKDQKIAGKAPSKSVSPSGSTGRVPDRARRGNQPPIR